MSDEVTLRIDGREVTVAGGTTVAAAMLAAGIDAFRTSAGGEPRGPLCGMGICFECRVEIDGRPLARACRIECRAGMEVRSGGGS